MLISSLIGLCLSRDQPNNCALVLLADYGLLVYIFKYLAQTLTSVNTRKHIHVMESA
jgi:hypothetical protein